VCAHLAHGAMHSRLSKSIADFLRDGQRFHVACGFL
jgi:hypothetical protein